MTGRRFRLDKSVKGTGTRTMSPCRRFIPILVIHRIIPEAEGRTRCRGEVGQLLLMLLDHDDGEPLPGLEWPGQLDPTIPANFDVIPQSRTRVCVCRGHVLRPLAIAKRDRIKNRTAAVVSASVFGVGERSRGRNRGRERIARTNAPHGDGTRHPTRFHEGLPGRPTKIGVGGPDWVRAPLPPNRAGESPAHGSPVA
jgi:hypothetical protein